MKICIVTSSFPRFKGDYSGQFVYKQALGLSARHEVHVIYPTDRPNPEAARDPFQHHPFRYPFHTYPMSQVRGLDILNVIGLFFRMTREIRRVKKDFNIDLFYAFWTIPCAFICSLACGKTPFLIGMMGADDKVFGRAGIARPFIGRAVRKAARIIALSQELKLAALKLGAGGDKVAVIPTGIDLNAYKPVDKAAARAALGLPEGMLLLFVGSLFKLKRTDWLIRLSADLGKQSRFHTLIAGDGPERGKLENLAAHLECGNVRFLGRVAPDIVPSLMAASDVLVLLSETEGLPSCIQEAMACGIPVVATAVGGIPDIVKDGVTGYLVNSESEARARLAQLMQTPELAPRLGRNARSFAEQHLSSSQLNDQINAVCESVLAASPGEVKAGLAARVMPGEKPNIGVVSASAAQFLSGLMDVQAPLAKNVYVVTPSLSKPGLPNIKVFPFPYNLGRNIMSQAFNQAVAQVRMSVRVWKLADKADFWVFVGGDVFLLPVLTARLIKAPVLMVLIGNLEQETRVKKNVLNPVQVWLRKINFALSDRIVVFSQELVKQWRLEKYRAKILIAQSQYVDLEKFSVKKPFEERKKLVGYIGRLSPEKGIWELVKSTAQALAQDDALSFMVVGNGRLLPDIKKYVTGARLEDRVKLLGRVPHDAVPQHMNELRLLVMPSYTEGMPGAMLEAMSCGTPVLATKVGAVADIIADGDTGFLLEHNSPREIAESIIRALRDPRLAAVAGRARQLVESEFSLAAAQRNYQRVIEEGVRLSTARKKKRVEGADFVFQR